MNWREACFGSILLEKSKIERLQKSREGRLLGFSAPARLFKTITGIRGCVCANRFGPSRRRAWNASAVLKNLVRRPKRTFSTLSATTGLMHCGKSTLRDHLVGTRAKCPRRGACAHHRVERTDRDARHEVRSMRSRETSSTK